MEDFAVAVSHGGEIQADHGQAVGGGFVALPVPEGFHDVQTGLFAHTAQIPSRRFQTNRTCHLTFGQSYSTLATAL